MKIAYCIATDPFIALSQPTQSASLPNTKTSTKEAQLKGGDKYTCQFFCYKMKGKHVTTAPPTVLNYCSKYNKEV